MNVLVQAKSLEVTDGIRSFVEKQAQKVSKVGVPIPLMTVYLEMVERKDHEANRCVVSCKTELAGKDVLVKKHGVDLYAVIVDAIEGTIRGVREVKEKRIAQKRKRTKATALMADEI